MTPEQARQSLHLIKAFAEGKTIQSKQPDGTWYDLISPSFIDGTYRIKPNAKHRPYTPEEAKTLVGKTIIGKQTGHHYLIIACFNPSGVLRINNESVTPSALLDLYTFTSGSPCGVLINE